MDAMLEWPSAFWKFLLFLPFFLGLFLLGVIKGLIVLPFSIAVLSIGNSVVLLGLWPAHVIWMYYSVARTRKLGPILKIVLYIVLPVPFFLALVIGVLGSVLVGLGSGFFTPLVATFEAVREGRQNKFIHCFVDGVWETVRGSCTVVRDFTDFCYHSYFSYLRDFRNDPPQNGEPYEIRLLGLLGCALVGILGLLLDFPSITLVAIVKSPYMLFRGWRRLLQDLVGREGPFLETVCVPVAGLAILLWPLVVVVAVVSALLSSIFIGLYGAVVVYQEGSIRCGLAYIVAVVAQFDEYTNDLLYLREGSCLPRPHYRKKKVPESESFSTTRKVPESESFSTTRKVPESESFSTTRPVTSAWQWPGEGGGSPIPTPRSMGSTTSRSGSEASVYSGAYTRSLRQTLQEVKMVQIWDNIFRTCERQGKELLLADVIKVGDLEEWLRSSSSSKSRLIGVGLPAYTLLMNLIQSGKAGVAGLLLSDGVEVTMENRPQDLVFDWFFEPLLVLKEQIKAASLSETEELYLLKWVLLTGDSARMTAWENGGLQPEDDVRRGELQAWSRRVQGIATSVSRFPTFRRRYQGIVRVLIAFVQNNFSSPVGKTKGSPVSSTSSSSEAGVRYIKPQVARFTESNLHRVLSPGKTAGGEWKSYSSLDGDDKV